MQIEHEGNRFRITMNVEEALALQRDMSAELLRVAQFKLPGTCCMPIIHKEDSRHAYPSALLVTIEEVKRGPASVINWNRRV